MFAHTQGRDLRPAGPKIGAGKVTTVKILTTLSRADSDTAMVAGYGVAREPGCVWREVGAVSQ